ncbi:MAG: hypothetical protein OXC93_00870 [Rhodospirillaceae bacterium]|nr:hypothetical protein [Rhodospirillaceae bacterium]
MASPALRMLLGRIGTNTVQHIGLVHHAAMQAQRITTLPRYERKPLVHRAYMGRKELTWDAPVPDSQDIDIEFWFVRYDSALPLIEFNILDVTHNGDGVRERQIPYRGLP